MRQTLYDESFTYIESIEPRCFYYLIGRIAIR